MERITDCIKEDKAREYFGQVAEGNKPNVEISADEYEAGIGQVLDRLDTVLDDAREFSSTAGNMLHNISEIMGNDGKISYFCGVKNHSNPNPTLL